MRIAIINETYTAGATRCAVDLQRGHEALGHQTRYYPPCAEFSETDLLTDLAVFKPDVVHLHSFYGHFPYSLMATVSNRYPTCFTPHDPRAMGTMETICWDCGEAKTCFSCPMVSVPRRRTVVLNRFYRQRLMKRRVHRACSADLMLAFPSQWIADRFSQTELARFRSVVVPNGIDTSVYRHQEDARKRLGWAEDEPTVLYIAHSAGLGLGNPRKGLGYLATAFVEKVLPRFGSARLKVVGEGLVPNHPRIEGLGAIEHDLLPLYYSAADMFACPTLADNLPYTVMEAMACGKPVIASRVGGVPEQVDNEVTGILCGKANVSELGSALCQLMADPEMAREMGVRGRQRVEDEFSMERFVRAYESLYQQMTATVAVSAS